MQYSSNNKFSKIDRNIQEWALQNKLLLQTQYRDYEVRSFQMNDKTGKKSFQMWIEPTKNGNFIIKIWDYKKRKKEIKSSPEEIEIKLSLGLQVIYEWIKGEM